jgi:hypothetical protein
MRSLCLIFPNDNRFNDLQYYIYILVNAMVCRRCSLSPAIGGLAGSTTPRAVSHVVLAVAHPKESYLVVDSENVLASVELE